jgi:hypothetical protein
MLADLSPALLCPRPSICPGGSFRCRFAGFAAFWPIAFGGFDGWRAVEGGRFADMDGDGDDLEDMAPLVWIPGGAGRLTLVGMPGWTAVMTGAMSGLGRLAARMQPLLTLESSFLET